VELRVGEYLCTECLDGQAIVRLRRAGGFWCPVNSDHNPQENPPILITRWPNRATMAYSRRSTPEQLRTLTALAARVEAALPAIFEAFDAAEGLASAKRRKWRALAQLPHGWRLEDS